MNTTSLISEMTPCENTSHAIVLLQSESTFLFVLTNSFATAEFKTLKWQGMLRTTVIPVIRVQKIEKNYSNFMKVKSSKGISQPCFTRSHAQVALQCVMQYLLHFTDSLRNDSHLSSSERISMAVVPSEEKFVRVSGKLITR